MKTKITPNEFNPVEFWQLGALPRFPKSTTTWGEKITIITPQASYLSALVDDTRLRHPFLIVPRLTDPEWRLAFYHRQSPPRSGLPTVNSVLAGCRRNGWMTDVPAEWIGAKSTTEVCMALSRAVHGFTSAESEGFTVILRLFRAIPLEKNEVLQLNWSDLDWVRAFISGVVFTHTSHAPSPSLRREGNPHAA